MRYHLSARALVDSSAPKQKVTLFGRTYDAPFGISAIGFAGNMRRHADQMLAEAAAEANLPFILSGVSCASIEQVTRIAPGRIWQQLYMARDTTVSDDVIQRAQDTGVDVLVITVDAPAPLYNHWLVKRGLKLPVQVPPRVWPYILWQAALHPRWSWEHGSRGGLPRLESFARYARKGAGAKEVADIVARNIPSFHGWSEIERIRTRWKGTLVIKGIVDPADSARCRELGADAITVSNHGGNKLARMLPSIDTLRHMRRDDPTTTMLFDGGIRRGSDILIALGLGAAFCFSGRAVLYGAMAAGVPGALRSIAILKTEIERTLQMIGCPDVTAIDEGFLRLP
jgi:(S)-mandelate dehydrogenase